jgi:hypothetical protein
MTVPDIGACEASIETPFDRRLVMMMESWGVGMMVMMWVAGVLGLALLASLVVLVWVVIGRLRRKP